MKFIKITRIPHLYNKGVKTLLWLDNVSLNDMLKVLNDYNICPLTFKDSKFKVFIIYASPCNNINIHYFPKLNMLKITTFRKNK